MLHLSSVYGTKALEKSTNIYVDTRFFICTPLKFRALESLNYIKKTQPRIMCATFNIIPGSTIVTGYFFNNTIEKIDITTFYMWLSSLVRYIPRHNVLVIGADTNAPIGKSENNNFGLLYLS